MKRKDYFLCYSSKDQPIAYMLKKHLESHGVSVWIAPDDIPAGSNYTHVIHNAIRDTDGMIIVITENSLRSLWVRKELRMAILLAEDRSKPIIPLLFDITEVSNEFRFLLSGTQYFYIGSTDPLWIDKAIAPIIANLDRKKKKVQKYEELAELKKSHLDLEASSALIDILEIIATEIDTASTIRSQYELMIELDQCLGQLHELYDFDYSPPGRAVAERKNTILGRLNQLIRAIDDNKQDLFDVCFRIRFIYWGRKIRWDYIDAHTHGDLSDGIIKAAPEDEAAELQREYREIYLSADKGSAPDQPKVIEDFILNTEKYLYEWPGTTSKQSRVSAPESTPSKYEDKLKAIAGFIREGNRVFEMIGEDEKAADFIRCLITSYERLKNYCEEIGAREITAECIARISTLKQKYLRLTDTQPPEHSTAEKGIRALLGFTRPGLGTYDVFLSHKSYDADIAQEVYQFLKSNMREVFYDKISLPELSKAEYKNAILQALDKSKHFVVILTDIKLLEPQEEMDENDWVQREMDTFHTELFEGRKKGGNFVILVTDEVFEQLAKQNKMNMDIKWRAYNLIRVRDYKDQIMSYLK